MPHTSTTRARRKTRARGRGTSPVRALRGAHGTLPVYSGRFGETQAERLLWRAGFGPRPGEAQGAGQARPEAARSCR